jgi:hypothetical protein
VEMSWSSCARVCSRPGMILSLVQKWKRMNVRDLYAKSDKLSVWTDLDLKFLIGRWFACFHWNVVCTGYFLARPMKLPLCAVTRRSRVQVVETVSYKNCRERLRTKIPSGPTLPRTPCKAGASCTGLPFFLNWMWIIKSFSRAA